MKLRDAFRKAFGIKESSSSSSSVKIVPRYPEETPAQKAEKEIKEYFVPRHLKDYAQDVRDYVESKKQNQEQKYNKDKCNPKTCWGECGGNGWCHIAQEWQKKIHHHNNFNTFVKIKKVKTKGYSKKYKQNKKWKKIHQKKSKRFRKNF